MLIRLLKDESYALFFQQSLWAGLSPSSVEPEVVVLDVPDSLETTLRFLPSLKKSYAQAELVLLVPPTEMTFWMEAIHQGAWECLPKPVAEHEMKATLKGAVEAVSRREFTKFTSRLHQTNVVKFLRRH
ncbi:MAG: hypothetical protein AB1898_24385 [Acidobacteriota bacterium]